MRASRRQSEMQRQIDAFRARVLRLESASTQLLSATYADALATLEPRIVEIARQIAEARTNGEDPNLSWLFQQERYQELRRQIVALMDQYGQATKIITTEAQKAIVRESLVHAGDMLLSVSGGSGEEIATLARGWAAVPDATVIDLVGALQEGTPLDRTIQSYGVDAVDDVQKALTRGLALGDSAALTTRALSALGITRARAESLVRTETLRAARSATLAAFQQSGVVRGWRWSAAHSARTCAACLAMDGRVFTLSEPHRFHVNCFPAGTLCSGPQPIASSKRWYVGNLIDIRFASGDYLSVTPNHPILTPHGWVAAGLLNEGSSVIRSSLSEREVASVYPNYQDGPALIEEVAESLGSDGAMVSVSMPVSAEDFHGDGLGSDVSVIRTDRLLRRGFDATVGKPSLHDEFGRRSVGLSLFSCLGFLGEFVRRTLTAANSVMRFCRECLTFLGGGLGHSYVHPLGAIPGGDAMFFQNPVDNRSGRSILFSKRLARSATSVSVHDFGLRPSGTGFTSSRSSLPDQLGSLSISTVKPSFDQGSLESLGTEPADSFTDTLHALAGRIELDRVLQIGVRAYQGHVYNLETTDGWYISNNIITHNCRCAISPVLKGESDEPAFQTGADWLADQPTDVQRQVLGIQGQQAYFNGDIELDDFVQLHRDSTWGDSYHQGSLTYALERAARSRKAAA